MGAVQTSAWTGEMMDDVVSERGRGERCAGGSSERAARHEPDSEVAISRDFELAAAAPAAGGPPPMAAARLARRRPRSARRCTP